MAHINKVICDGCGKDVDSEIAEELDFRFPIIFKTSINENIYSKSVDLCPECAKKIIDACKDIITLRI